jgi:signal transduction protein with GAF and PtsI domain
MWEPKSLSTESGSQSQQGLLTFQIYQRVLNILSTIGIKTLKVYKGVNRAANRNECARLLMSEGYATDPDYATKLIQLMDRQLATPGNAVPTVKEKILTVPILLSTRQSVQTRES